MSGSETAFAVPNCAQMSDPAKVCLLRTVLDDESSRAHPLAYIKLALAWFFGMMMADRKPCQFGPE